MSLPERQPLDGKSIDRLRRGIGALVAGTVALLLQGDVGAFQIAVALALALAVFELLGRAFARWSPSKDPNDYRD